MKKTGEIGKKLIEEERKVRGAEINSAWEPVWGEPSFDRLSRRICVLKTECERIEARLEAHRDTFKKWGIDIE